MKTIIIQGSSRSHGNTSQIVEILKSRLKSRMKSRLKCDVIDLKKKNIGAYDYEHLNKHDDFLHTMRTIVEYDLIIFATPVYWYSMSGLIKNFLDRITDCLKVEKDLGRRLRGKQMATISCGSDNIVTNGFFVPFESSAEYLGMKYLGSLHTWIDGNTATEDVVNSIEEFAKKLIV